MKINSLPDKGSKVIIIKMFNKLGKRRDELRILTELKNIKTTQNALKSTVTEIKKYT